MAVPKDRKGEAGEDGQDGAEAKDSRDDKEGKDASDENEGGTTTYAPPDRTPTIAFDPSVNAHPRHDETLYIPGPRERDSGEQAARAPSCLGFWVLIRGKN